jgi:hypothetical protein
MKLGTERLEPGIVSLVLLNREAFSRKGKMWENEQFVPTPYSAETDVNVIELRLTDGSYNKTMFRFLTLEFVDGVSKPVANCELGDVHFVDAVATEKHAPVPYRDGNDSNRKPVILNSRAGNIKEKVLG